MGTPEKHLIKGERKEKWFNVYGAGEGAMKSEMQKLSNNRREIQKHDVPHNSCNQLRLCKTHTLFKPRWHVAMFAQS